MELTKELSYVISQRLYNKLESAFEQRYPNKPYDHKEPIVYLDKDWRKEIQNVFSFRPSEMYQCDRRIGYNVLARAEGTAQSFYNGYALSGTAIHEFIENRWSGVGTTSSIECEVFGLFPRFKVHGFIDILEQFKDFQVVVDIKTKSMKYRRELPQLTYEFEQINLYAGLIGAPFMAIIWMDSANITTNRIDVMEFDESLFITTIQRMGAIVDAYQAKGKDPGVYPLTIPAKFNPDVDKHCKYCEMKSVCMRHNKRTL